jgi:hypothetical protein
MVMQPAVFSRLLRDERENSYGNEEGSEEVRQEGS